MAKVGQFIIDPRAGAYCRITLDSGEKIVVNHDKGGFKGGMITVEKVKLLGLSSERIFACNLDSDAGRAILAHLTRHVPTDAARATPLGAFVEHLKDCTSMAEVKTRCESLSPGP